MPQRQHQQAVSRVSSLSMDSSMRIRNPTARKERCRLAMNKGVTRADRQMSSPGIPKEMRNVRNWLWARLLHFSSSGELVDFIIFRESYFHITISHSKQQVFPWQSSNLHPGRDSVVQPIFHWDRIPCGTGQSPRSLHRSGDKV